ncbi:hypothetical protein [Mycolicibacterium insubricum]|uniref:hypothetical protein n=1 Tax=Mycolicibacterium insubricum TaxID=444597 RepID=UPI0021F2D7C6|nr:hypothetical protein [Mycolicibacterium insubricum]
MRPAGDPRPQRRDSVVDGLDGDRPPVGGVRLGEGERRCVQPVFGARSAGVADSDDDLPGGGVVGGLGFGGKVDDPHHEYLSISDCL